MSTCLICDKHLQLREFIYEDNYWIVSYGPFNSQVSGYVYIEPKRHVENWTDFTDEELTTVGPLIKRVEVALKTELSIERAYVLTISEAVRHIHFHIIPRLKESNFKGLDLIKQATQQSADSISVSQEEYTKLMKNLQNYFVNK